MDCHKILSALVKFDCGERENISEELLEKILTSIYPLISEELLQTISHDRKSVNAPEDTGWQYLHLLLNVIKTLCDTDLSDENPLLTVDQFRTIKTAVETAACIGIIPSLAPQIKTHATNTHSKSFKPKFENDGILEKYKRLSYTVNKFLEYFDKTILRPALITQLDCLLAALLQLSHAPLKKPSNLQENPTTSDFHMTSELYNQFFNEQKAFKRKLHEFLENCPQTELMKEFMVILGIKNNPKWLQTIIKSYLTERIMLPNGIAILTTAICDEVTDLGKCWNKLDITAQLVATSHGPNSEVYYDSICHQILEMFTSRNRQRVLIANCCIKALHDHKPDLCTRKIIHPMMRPFLSKYSSDSNLPDIDETEISESLEKLHRLFITADAEFRSLPITLLSPALIPLFNLYAKAHKSIYAFRTHARELLLKFLREVENRELIFSVILDHDIVKSQDFGEKLNFSFGDGGGLKINSKSQPVEYEEIADCLFELVKDSESLSSELFIHLLKILPKMNNETEQAEKGKILEMPTDSLARLERHVISVKLLTLLADLPKVQEAQTKNPQPFLEFIKFFFSKIESGQSKNLDESESELDCNVLYSSLMFIKIILTEKNVSKWETFQNFIATIKQEFNLKKFPSHINSIIEEIDTIIKKKGKSSKNYFDLSASQKLNEFDAAVIDLADPLLPVRAHGIITLTHLIEKRHPEASAKKDFLLCTFQENLKHDDSFIYLAAINGICAMSSMFPDRVIGILAQEYIGMTSKPGDREIAPETRSKLGEVLVKTTRGLGEMIPKYKNLLVNAFLCGTRDPDSLVRASSLSCLGEFCKVMGFRLGNLMIEILYCISCIIKTDKDDCCRRAGVLVATLLLRGLGNDALIELGENLVPLYRSLKHLRDNDRDPVIQLHAQLALEEFNDIVQQFLLGPPKLEKTIFLLSNQ
ncbi:hypothetical protein QAD02_016731 [Eretmocerus hayati]|uniref:Uncharacterized protein n=1 Tax=Eretmocerus hayati TaxID=131215 RepID=A0ACC2PEE1_9HYME|nr:hypothetical protein QAD02_016731 [Eretmocerus hayati]